MPPVPPAFVDIFCKIYGDKMLKLFKNDHDKWEDFKKSMKTSMAIKPDPMDMLCLAAMTRIEFEQKILNEDKHTFITALKEME